MSVDEALALDALYNAARRRAGAPAHYLTLRRQLLQRKEAPVEHAYLLLRQTLLSQKYGPPPASQSFERRASARPRYDRTSTTTSTRTSLSRGMSWGTTRTTSFAEMPAEPSPTSSVIDGRLVFSHHKQAVAVVRFANRSPTRFACGSADGTASLCEIKEDPDAPRMLTGHSKGITDLQWSADDTFLITTSKDGTVRLWKTEDGSLVRTMKDIAAVLCCCFNSENNNLFVVGNSNGDLKTYNLSTGKPVIDSAVNIRSAVTAVVFDPLGRLLYAGTEYGELHVFAYASGHGSFVRLYKAMVSSNRPRPICSLALAPSLTKEAHQPCLLVSAKDNTVKLYGVGSFSKRRAAPSTAVAPSRLTTIASRLQFAITLEAQFPIKHYSTDVNAVFCPLMSMQKDQCFVTGAEDCTIQLFRTSPNKLVQKLKGHAAPVLCINWNHDESLLVSSDLAGAVMVWKRAVFTF